MPIPFRDTEDIRSVGVAAYLHFESTPGDDSTYFGAMFVVNARGEPLEFVFNRLELMREGLWRPADRRSAGLSRLAVSLFAAARLTPSLLFCRAGTVDATMFGPSGRLAVEMPIGIVDPDGTVVWAGSPPDGASAELFRLLAMRDLVAEPFERAARGMRIVYADALGPPDA